MISFENMCYNKNVFVALSVYVRGLCRSLWMICLLQSSASVNPYLWLLSTFLTCWMSKRCSTVLQTLR